MNLDAEQLPPQSVLIGVGVLLAAAVALLVARRRRVPRDEVLALFGVSVVAAGFGSRLGWALLEPSVGASLFWEHPSLLIDLRRGGHNSFGALGAAALVVATWFAAHDKNRRLAMLDVLVPAGLLGLATARIGCAFNGCDFGRPTAVDWAVRHSSGTQAFAEHVHQTAVSAHAAWSAPVHPFALYLGVGTAAIAVVALVMTALEDTTSGKVAAFAAGAYFALRLVVEWTREPALSPFRAATLNVHQWLCAAALAVIVMLVLYLRACSERPGKT